MDSDIDAIELTAPTLTTIARLVDRIGDLEAPAAGTWSVQPASHVALARHGRLDRPVAAQVVGGAFEIGEFLEHSSLHLDLRGPAPLVFNGRPTRVEADRHGLSRWSIAGVLSHEGWSDPMSLSVSCHGVYRTAGHAWAWLSGSGALDAARSARSRRFASVERRLVVVDLLLVPSSSPSSVNAN
jgi:hypothetical protein